MKQVLQDGRSGRVTVEEVPAPPVPAGGVLVRTAASVLSAGTERSLVEFTGRSLLGKAWARPDLVRQVWDRVQGDGIGAAYAAVGGRLDRLLVLGYSSAGTVVAVGIGAEDVRVGTPVACAGAGYAIHAEIVAVPRTLCAPIPVGPDGAPVPMEDAAFATLGAVALQGVRLAKPTLGERVVVVGVGVLGQLAVQLFRAHGCAVLALDPDPGRAALARNLGAEVALTAINPPPVAEILAFTRGRGADAVLIAADTESNGPVELAGEVSRRKGRVVVVGQVRMDVPRRSYYHRELSLTVSCSYGPGRYDPQYEEYGRDYPVAYVRWTEQRNLEAFLDLLAAGRVRVAPLITHRVPLAQAERAYALLGPARAEGALGIVLTYPSSFGPPARTVGLARRATAAPAAGVVTVAAVGSGTFARSVLFPALRRAGGMRLRAVVASSGASALSAARRFGFEQAATDLPAVLADPDVQAVFVATPHRHHAALATAALEAGRHVFVEKPLCVAEHELHHLAGCYRALAVRPAPPILTVGFNRRFSPLSAQLRTEVGGLGPLVLVHRVNAGALPAGHWLAAPEEGGRIVGEACHVVDLALFLTSARPSRVFAAGPAGASEPTSLVVELSDGSLLTVLYVTSGSRRMPKERLEVFGGGRSWVLEDWRRLWSFEAARVRRVRRWTAAKGHAEAVQAFLAAVRAGGPEPIPFDEIVATTQVTFAALESLRRRAPVDIPPLPHRGEGDE
jgi:predicted dehydrogenase